MSQTADMPRSIQFQNENLKMYTDEGIQRLISSGVRMALEEDRTSRKLGREDRGSGDEYIGKQLKFAREGAGMSQRQLAEQAGLHPTTIGKIETGERGMSLRVFCRLAWALPEDNARGLVYNVMEWLGS
jgi:DNA-binding XRE family transcriptional regulator